jgi:hypothetical protein
MELSLFALRRRDIFTGEGLKMYKENMIQIHGAKFTDQFDQAFDISGDVEGQVIFQPKTKSLFQKLSRSKAFWYLLGLADGILLIFVFYYLLR